MPLLYITVRALLLLPLRSTWQSLQWLAGQTWSTGFMFIRLRFLKRLPFNQTRTYIAALTRTDRIFLEDIPPPPSWPASVPLSIDQAALVKLAAWKESSGNKHRLDIMIGALQVAILNNRKRKIQWPTGGYISSKCVPDSNTYHGLIADQTNWY